MAASDTHGFAILDGLRSHFSHVSSFLMDRETLTAHQPLSGMKERHLRVDLKQPTSAKASLYDDLRYDSIRENLRLEQEHVNFRWVCDRLLR
ncbi:Wadjet anti-phage system protein JetD domain-containing protein [Herbaspirillum sp. SJZ106]